jgi:hypothetical protein
MQNVMPQRLMHTGKIEIVHALCKIAESRTDGVND